MTVRIHPEGSHQSLQPRWAPSGQVSSCDRQSITGPGVNCPNLLFEKPPQDTFKNTSEVTHIEESVAVELLLPPQTAPEHKLHLTG